MAFKDNHLDALDPYAKGRSEHLAMTERILDSANTFKKIAIGSTLIAVIATSMAGYLATRSEYVPFIIRADKVTGFAEGLGPIHQVDYTPTEVEKKYFLTEFIKKVRTVPLDPVVYQHNWEEASTFLTQGSSAKIKEISESQGYFQKLGTMTAEPVILGITRLSNSENTYQIRWQEQNYGLNSGITSKDNYIGTFTIETGQVSASSEAELYKNPLGIKVTDLSFSLENNAVKGGK